MTEPPASLILARLDQIEAKLDRLISGPQPEVIGVKEVMRLVGCRSVTSTYRIMATLGIRPYLKGKYRRREVEHAVARRALEAQLSSQRSFGEKR